MPQSSWIVSSSTRKIDDLFHFVEAWVESPECHALVEKSWAVHVAGHHSWKLTFKSLTVGRALRYWQWLKWETTKARISYCEKHLEEFQHGTMSKEFEGGKEVTEFACGALEESRKCVEKKHSMQVWLHEGDSNTIFFNTSTSVRTKRNCIEGSVELSWHQSR